MNHDQFVAVLNPDWPGKGERHWCVFRIYHDGVRTKLDKQFNIKRTAIQYAYKLECIYWRNRTRRIYVGD